MGGLLWWCTCTKCANVRWGWRADVQGGSWVEALQQRAWPGNVLLVCMEGSQVQTSAVCGSNEGTVCARGGRTGSKCGARVH